MNLIGHNYIAYKVLGHVSPETILGSHIPDLVPFLPSSTFSFHEIHENHVDFLEFTKSNYPNMVDLPLSMMCHSVEYGADGSSKHIADWLLEGDEKQKQVLANKIVEVSRVSFEMAIGPRLHNYLWCGIDLYLIKNNPKNVTTKLAKKFMEIDYKKAAETLSAFYNKDQKAVEKNLTDHFSMINPKSFTTVEGFVESMKILLASLNQGDKFDDEKGPELLEHIYKTYENQWETVLQRVVSDVKNKIQVSTK